MGEKLEDLQQFYPDRMTSRILGMGDVFTLIEKAENAVNLRVSHPYLHIISAYLLLHEYKSER